MSNPVVGAMLPSQRLRLAVAYEEVAKVYAEAGHAAAARINCLLAASFRKAVDEPIMNLMERADAQQ